MQIVVFQHFDDTKTLQCGRRPPQAFVCPVLDTREPLLLQGRRRQNVELWRLPILRGKQLVRIHNCPWQTVYKLRVGHLALKVVNMDDELCIDKRREASRENM